MTQFDRIIQAFMMITMPNAPQSGEEVSFMATGLNGYVTHIIIRWVSEVLNNPGGCFICLLCSVLSFIETTAQKIKIILQFCDKQNKRFRWQI